MRRIVSLMVLVALVVASLSLNGVDKLYASDA